MMAHVCIIRFIRLGRNTCNISQSIPNEYFSVIRDIRDNVVLISINVLTKGIILNRKSIYNITIRVSFLVNSYFIDICKIYMEFMFFIFHHQHSFERYPYQCPTIYKYIRCPKWEIEIDTWNTFVHWPIFFPQARSPTSQGLVYPLRLLNLEPMTVEIASRQYWNWSVCTFFASR